MAYITACTTVQAVIHRQKTDLIICPMLWYSNGTDKNIRFTDAEKNEDDATTEHDESLGVKRRSVLTVYICQ